MSKYKFRIFVFFAFLVIAFLIYLILFIQTTKKEVQTSYSIHRAFDLSINDEDDVYYYATLKYTGIQKDNKIIFQSKNLEFRQYREIFGYFKLFNKNTSKIIYPENVVKKDGWVSFNGYNQELKIRIEKETDFDKLGYFHSFFYKLAPSPTFSELYLDFTLKTFNNEEEVISSGYQTTNIFSKKANINKETKVVIESIPSLREKNEESFWLTKWFDTFIDEGSSKTKEVTEKILE